MMLLRCEMELQGSPRGQGPPRFGCCELAQQADEPQMGKTIWGLFYIGVENDAAGHVIEPQGSPRGQGPPRFGCCELAQQADEPQMGKTVWGLFYVWVK